MHCLLILPLICSYMWDLTSMTHIWCISGFVLKIEYYKLEQYTNHIKRFENGSTHCYGHTSIKSTLVGATVQKKRLYRLLYYIKEKPCICLIYYFSWAKLCEKFFRSD